MRSRVHRKPRRLSDNLRFFGSRREAQRKHALMTVDVMLPLSVARRARREIYTYPYPAQRQLRRFHIRSPLIRRREKFVPVKVRIRVPRRLPVLGTSSVLFDRGRMVIQSRRAVERILARGELNRLRYEEGKPGHRKARYGQAESFGALSGGIVAEAVHNGFSPARIADAALVARALRRF